MNRRNMKIVNQKTESAVENYIWERSKSHEHLLQLIEKSPQNCQSKWIQDARKNLTTKINPNFRNQKLRHRSHSNVQRHQKRLHYCNKPSSRSCDDSSSVHSST